ncbi:Aldehyde/histidinol dehydrogenase [Aspergillus caelatus]|uniref:Aldehyde dehydrogenase n=1 Tax=Aspergillus caelatus TaxID=61420 RepID=A0A5N7A195_9EURO|nr:Aldehyde/histidinol dehydrogenase [Aspergillus caelatus]KAE8363634.1 Aldehyde/histidinol dehydrogenase [Aspergillus caelatus]
MSNFITDDEFRSLHQKLRATFANNRTRDVRWRKWQLKQLFWLLDENEDALVKAMAADLHRHAFESLSYDVGDVKNTILTMLKNVDTWSQGAPPPEAGLFFRYVGKAWIRKEPRGVVLVIGAWNYPLSTLLSVAAAAIAAGNCVILKPSEIARHTEVLLSELVPTYLDTSALALIRADPAAMGRILEYKFDFIFYTGSTRVGRIIAEAAAKHVTPTALELGGQAPAIVTKSADIEVTAKRLVAAKLTNLGQICVCVNHIYVDPEVHDQLVARLIYWTEQFSKGDGLDGLARMVGERQYDRLHDLLERTEGNKVFEGPHSRKERLIFPTIVTDVKPEDSLLSEELFGPVLPVVKITVPEVLDILRSSPYPLGLYIFSNDSTEIDIILNSTNSGGVTINDVAIHADVPSAPFGGVGDSGYGAYHGKWGFDTFSHNRTVVRVPGWIDHFVQWRYPPFDIKNRSETDAPQPTFKKGETLEDQGPSGMGCVVM